MEAAILSEDPLGGAHIGPLLVLLQPLQGQLERPVGVGAAAEAARASRPHSGARALARRADPAARHAGAAAYAARRSAAPALPIAQRGPLRHPGAAADTAARQTDAQRHQHEGAIGAWTQGMLRALRARCSSRRPPSRF